MEALEAKNTWTVRNTHTFQDQHFWPDPDRRTICPKAETCAGTGGLVTTEVNFLGIELRSAMCTSYSIEIYVRIAVVEFGWLER